MTENYLAYCFKKSSSLLYHSSSFATNLGGWFHLLFCCSLNLGWFHMLNIMDNRISIKAIVKHIFENLYIMDVNCLCFIMITNWYSNLISLSFFFFFFFFSGHQQFSWSYKVELKSMRAWLGAYFDWGKLISRLSIQCSLFLFLFLSLSRNNMIYVFREPKFISNLLM